MICSCDWPESQGLQLSIAWRDSAGEKVECVLVSQDPSQYMMGLVPFEFKDRQVASKAAAPFANDSAREVTTPAIDAKEKPD